MGIKVIPWTEEYFRTLIKLADEVKLLNTIRGTEKEKPFRIELGAKYPLEKDLFGVKIESGNISIQKIIMKDILSMMDNFLEIRKIGSGFDLIIKTDLTEMVMLTKKYKLELPNLDVIQGYILNHELINLVRGEHDYLQFKYKDSPENIFYLYKFYFTRIRKELYLVIEKNI